MSAALACRIRNSRSRYNMTRIRLTENLVFGAESGSSSRKGRVTRDLRLAKNYHLDLACANPVAVIGRAVFLSASLTASTAFPAKNVGLGLGCLSPRTIDSFRGVPLRKGQPNLVRLFAHLQWFPHSVICPPPEN